MSKKMQDLRENYSLGSLERRQLNANPLDQFKSWFDQAMQAELAEPNAMVLSTTDGSRVFSRVVLLKELNEAGFIFYTNYQSAKGQQIGIQPQVALTFLWKELERQVRIEGVAEKISKEKSMQYFHSRPKSSQIGAWVSNQSRVIEDRSILESKKADLESQYTKYDQLPKPEHWGGYIVRPDMIEFWQGRESRLHDRFQYSLDKLGEWIIERLSP